MPSSIAPGSSNPAPPRLRGNTLAAAARGALCALAAVVIAVCLTIHPRGVRAQTVTPAPAGAQAAAQAVGPVLQSDPRKVSTVAEQAGRLLREGRPADALAMLDAGLREHPGNPQLRFLYGVAQADRGRTADAIDGFLQLAADFPELAAPHNNLAVLYANSGELEKARAALEEAIRAAPGYALAHENLGDLYLRLAARAYERALEIDRRSESARSKLVMARELIAGIGGPAAPVPTPVAKPEPAVDGAAAKKSVEGGETGASRDRNGGGQSKVGTKERSNGKTTPGKRATTAR